jgi:hypothetical protein
MVFVVQFTNEADKIGGERAAGLINGMKPSFILEIIPISFMYVC